MRVLESLRFRSSRSVELRPIASFAAAEREQFRDAESDPDLYGFFIAKPPFTMTVKSTGRNTAELFASLATPAHVDRTLLDDEPHALIDLVLDGILEIECGDGFVSGADALGIVGAAIPAEGHALSDDALRHAQELETNDPETLAMALYRYNHLPLTPFWRKRFEDAEAILAHVGADRGMLRTMLERDWSLSVKTSAWLSWTSFMVPRREDRHATYKLYVSPRPERIGDAFAALVRVLAAVPASFKLGSRAAGLLRPDKLVAYFATREQLEEAAACMRRELAGCDAQGVPFTAAIDDSGLLSWGVDPPDDHQTVRWLQHMSWRGWLVQRLGGALAVAKAARTASAVEPWRFALARMQRLGVDVGSWIPVTAFRETS